MKIKTFDWINKPEKVNIINSKKISYISKTEHYLVHTYSNDCTLNFDLKAKDDITLGLCLILSNRYGLSFKVEKNQIIKTTKLFNSEAKDYFLLKTDEINFKVKKCKNELVFSFNDTVLSSFSYINIDQSLSIAVFSKGNSKVDISFNEF